MVLKSTFCWCSGFPLKAWFSLKILNLKMIKSTMVREILPQSEIIPVYEETSVSSHTFYPRWNFTPEWFHLGFTSKFHPGGNSVWSQRATAINFQPGPVLCSMLWLIQKILLHYHYFFCLNNWYNVQLASFVIFVKVYLKTFQ